MIAKEMFKDLNYEYYEDDKDNGVFYYMRSLEDDNTVIKFDKYFKSVSFHSKEREDFLITNIYVIKAILKQLEELGCVEDKSGRWI